MTDTHDIDRPCAYEVYDGPEPCDHPASAQYWEEDDEGRRTHLVCEGCLIEKAESEAALFAQEPTE